VTIPDWQSFSKEGSACLVLGRIGMWLEQLAARRIGTYL
jgi:hypothetical protein